MQSKYSLIHATSKKEIALLISASALSFQMVVVTIIGIGLGWFLDSRIGTKPLFLITLFVTGAAIGILSLVKEIQNLNKLVEAEGKK